MDRQGGVSSTSEDGAAAVEFAIVSALLFMLLFAIVFFGILFGQDLALGNGARQAARAAAVQSGTCQVIWDELSNGATSFQNQTDSLEMNVNVSTAPGGADLCPGGPPYASTTLPCEGQPVGTEVIVRATAVGQLSIPLVIDDAIDLEREGSYRCEYQVRP